MVVSSRAWCEDGLRRALDELDALRAMYAADEDAGSATSTRHPSSSSDPTSTSAETNDVAVTIARDALRAVDVPNLSHVPALHATVRFGGGGATIRVALPPGYPARTRPMVVAECASRHRGSDASWRMQLAADDAVEAAGWGTDIRADIERVSVGRNDPPASASSSDDDDEMEMKMKMKMNSAAARNARCPRWRRRGKPSSTTSHQSHRTKTTIRLPTRRGNRPSEDEAAGWCGSITSRAVSLF